MSDAVTAAGLHFPDSRAEAHERAREFRRLPPEDRWREIFGMMAFGLAMAQTSPHRAFIEERWAAQEKEWQRLQQELFAHHGN